MNGSGRSGRSSELLVLPATLLVLVVLSIFVLFTYRNTIHVLVAERRMEAESMARALAREFEGRGLPRDDELARRRPPARAVALVNADGDALVVSGEFTGPAPAQPVEPSWWEAVRAPAGNVISGMAPFPSGGRRLTMQVDLPARPLLVAARSVRVLVPVVLGVDCALLLLAALYLHHTLTPFDRLLRRARAAGRVPEASDDLGFLLRTFEEALETMSAPERDDLGALERTLAKSVESGLLLLGADGRVLALNEIGAELLGVEVPPPETPLEDLLADHPEPWRVLQQAVRERRGVERRELDLGDGRRTLGLTLHPLRRDDGDVRGFLAFFVDLTVVRRQAEERQLAESLVRVGELSAGVAHEMRNSLATLRGYLTLIERGQGRETVAEYVEEIRHETDHLKRVVDDFLTFARPDSTRMESVDLERLLRRSAADPALEGMPVQIRSEHRGVLRVHGDPQLLERALRNLLHNAAEAERAVGGEGPLELSFEVDGAEAEVVIRDRGAGIPHEIRPRLFHPFVSQRAGGVGLGLALTHRIVQLHHGSVGLSDRPGGGTAARLRLPLESASGASVTNGNKAA